jgi:hypothetical protein
MDAYRLAKHDPAVPARAQKPKGEEKRSSPRLPPSAIAALKSARIVAGPEVVLINISRGGALIETEARLMPGSTANIRLVAADAVFLIRGRVLRSQARSFQGPVLRFHCAIAFDEDFSLLADSKIESVASQVPESESPPRSEPAETQLESQTATVRDPAIVTIEIPVPPSGPDLRQIFGLNTW